MKKFIIVALLFGGLLLGIFEWLRHPLPPIEGTHSISGLIDQVDIYTDKYGVPHVFAENEKDLFYAAGYIAARDRLFQLSLVSLAVKGELSSVLGPGYLDKDIYFRTWKIHDTAKKIVNNMDARNKQIFENFCKGINFRIDEAFNDLPLEFKILGFKPNYWDPTIVAGYARMMAHEMSGSWKPEVIFGAVESYFGKEMLNDILPGEEVDIPTIAASLPVSILQSLDNVIESEYSIRNLFGDVSADIGSNNWVVSPSRTVKGHAYLANDPHLAFTQPPRWYEIHLSGGRFNVSGVCIAGIPLPVIGQNERTAWGFTNTMVDDLDFFIEKTNPDNEYQYFHEGKWLDMLVKTETFKIKGSSDSLINIRSTHHGPIISDVHSLKSFNNDMLSMKWAGHWITNELDAWVELTLMRNWNDFSNALKKFGVPGQNIVYADVDGNIGWRPAVYIPIRKRGYSMAPRPGWDKSYEWNGYVPFEEMPFLFNPPEGYISTANNRTIGNEFPYYVSGLWADPSRASRIKEVLGVKEKVGLDDMKLLQLDLTSNYSKEILPHILENVGTSDSKIYNRAIRFLNEWDHIENIGSEATLIFHSISNNIIKNIYYDELSLLGEKYYETFLGLKYITKRNLRGIMKNHNNKWVDDISTPNKKETINDIISISIKSGIQEIVDTFGPNWSNWKWGYAHSLTHKHILGDVKILDYLFNLNIGPYLSGGSDVTPNAGGYSLLKGFNQTSGASMRRIVDFSDMNKTSMILPTGQSGLHNSPHYRDQAPLYHNGKYRETNFKEDYIINNTEYKHLILLPVE